MTETNALITPAELARATVGMITTPQNIDPIYESNDLFEPVTVTILQRMRNPFDPIPEMHGATALYVFSDGVAYHAKGEKMVGYDKDGVQMTTVAVYDHFVAWQHRYVANNHSDDPTVSFHQGPIVRQITDRSPATPEQLNRKRLGQVWDMREPHIAYAVPLNNPKKDTP